MSRSQNTAWHRDAPPNWTFLQFRRGAGRELRRQWQKRQRAAGRRALRRGEEPEPIRPRHSVQYDYW